MFFSSLASASPPDHIALSKEVEQKLLSITSDQQAIRFYRQSLGLSRQSTDHRTRYNPQTSSQLFPKTQQKIISLTRNLLATTVARTIQTYVQHHDLNNLTYLDEHAETIEWMRSHSSLPPSVSDMMTFHSHLQAYFKNGLTLTNRPDDFEAFATFIDHRYPMLTGSQDSWVHLMEQGELEKISERLTEYWDAPASQSHLDGGPSELQDHRVSPLNYAHYYSQTRLWPIFRAYLLSLAIRAEAESLLSAEQTLTSIHNDQESDTLTRAKARICGKWQWTVHNHQNHGDHKLIMYLGESKDFPASQPQPTDVQIHGNTVYLLWKFPQGFQEDSLLLSNNDGRLEGTFQNTFGPYGSITGKRLSSCKK